MTSHYQNLEYNFLDRWASFWYQLKEVLELNPGKVLEVGIGNKTVYDYLKRAGIDVISVDIDQDTKPDVVGTVEKMPFPDSEFDVVLAAEILEHLPFEKFGANLAEIRRAAKNYAVITLPHWGRHVAVQLRLPFLKKLQWQYKFSFPALEHKFNGEHYWEVGKKGYALSKVKQEIKQAGFEIVKDYVMFEMPYHHMFVLKKSI